MGGQGPDLGAQRGAVPGRICASGGNLGRGHMPAQDALVIGLGYVGLPLAVQAARAGFRVTGFDTSAEIGSQDVIVICVPTPLATADGPDLGAVRAAPEPDGRLLGPLTLVARA